MSTEPRLDVDEAIRRAILFTLQLSNNEYKRLAALGPHSFIRALEQDGYTIVAAPAAPAAPALDPADTRPELVVWFHESEEICEHDNEPRDTWPCEIMADHLMRAFDLEPRITVRPDGTASFEGRHFHRLTEYGVLLEVAAERAEYARLANPEEP